jgi:hypothetical protein
MKMDWVQFIIGFNFTLLAILTWLQYRGMKDR